MFARSLFVSALVASQAVVFTSASTVHARQEASLFDPTDVTPQCQTNCASTVEVMFGHSCTDSSCLCTTDVNSGFKACLDCIYKSKSADSLEQTVLQNALAQYEDACKSNGGKTLPSLTVDGSAASSTPAGGSQTSSPSSTSKSSSAASQSGGSSSTTPPSPSGSSSGGSTSGGGSGAISITISSTIVACLAGGMMLVLGVCI